MGRSSLGLAIAHRHRQSLATLSPRLTLSVWRIALRQANEVGGDGSTITQYICDDHHSAPPRISAFLSSHRHLRRCISSQLRAAEWAALFFMKWIDIHQRIEEEDDKARGLFLNSPRWKRRVVGMSDAEQQRLCREVGCALRPPR
jgi:hypothetical protein